MEFTALYLWPVVLVASFVYDFAITRYVIAVDARAGVRAGLWSVATFLVGLIGTLGIVTVSRWLILPECFGLFFGTLVGVYSKKDSTCTRGCHIDPCDDEECWSNGAVAAQVRLRIGWYDR